MSIKRTSKRPSGDAQLAGRVDHPDVGDHQFRVGEPLPVLMSDADLMRVVGLGRTRFSLLKKQGRWDMFRVRGLVTSKPYSGALVQKWLDGAGAPQTQHGLRRLKLASR